MNHKTFLRILHLLPLFIFSSLFLSCFHAGKLSDSSPITIGAIYNLHGSQAALDIPSSKGAILAIDEANRNGGILGRHVELILKDGKSNTNTVKKQTSELINENPAATAIIGLSDTDMVLAAAPVAAPVDAVSPLRYRTIVFYRSATVHHGDRYAGYSTVPCLHGFPEAALTFS